MAPVTAQVTITFLDLAMTGVPFLVDLLCRSALVSEQSHQPPVPPSGALTETLRRQHFTTLGLDRRTRLRPTDHTLLALPKVLIQPVVARNIVGNTAWRVQIDGLEGSHESPAQAEAIANADIDILDAGIAVRHQAKGFLQEGALQPVHHESVKLAPHDDGRLAELAHEL